MSTTPAAIVPTTVPIYAPLQIHSYGPIDTPPALTSVSVVTSSYSAPTGTALVTPTTMPNGSSREGDDFQNSGGYIYVVLVISLVIALVYSTRACLSKRRERRRRVKEQDCEVPPGYSSHTNDTQIFEGDEERPSPSSSASPSPTYSSSGLIPDMSSVPASLLPSHPTIATVYSIQPPAPAHTTASNARPRHSLSAEPPAYDDLLGQSKLQRCASSMSIASDTITAASASANRNRSSRRSRQLA
ncbi:hypothetical protein BC939DRAFT_434935 [Gamsiella multidivaricata]|uniref:uncharacterized protein n=1 Tax=Gamsiella multidivaricata TaxID=101098 RepID=UPI00221E7D83|nr:uncharacterized protein BC939DRAFT_434935 [Gamsiella multidivaricata]KAI7832232.1 hypothetical protein BC939DRAFT_434935 [Gamsiella multidivaricata]